MEDALGFVCFGFSLLMLVLWGCFDAITHQYTPPNFATAADLRKKKIMQTANERKEEDCPICDGRTSYRLALHGAEEQYLFFCNRCKLHFKYAYWSQVDDYRKYLIVDAVCPECKGNHKPAIVGDIDTDRIPCEPCWDKEQAKPKTILIPPARTWRERKRRSWNPWMV